MTKMIGHKLSTKFTPQVLVALPGRADGRRETGVQAERNDGGEHPALLQDGQGGGEGAVSGGRGSVPCMYPGLQVGRSTGFLVGAHIKIVTLSF